MYCKGIIVTLALALLVPVYVVAADEFHDLQFQAERGDPACKGARFCGPSPQWLKGAQERQSRGNELRRSVSENAAEHPTECNINIGTSAVRYLQTGNDPFLFGLWLAKYHSDWLRGPGCNLAFLH